MYNLVDVLRVINVNDSVWERWKEGMGIGEDQRKRS